MRVEPAHKKREPLGSLFSRPSHRHYFSNRSRFGFCHTSMPAARNAAIRAAAAVTAGLRNIALECRYEYLCRRMQKLVIDAAANRLIYGRRFLYDGWNLVAEYVDTGSAHTPSAPTTPGVLARTYVWGLDIARSLVDAGGVGALLQMTDHASGKGYLPTYDGNGNVISLLNAETGVVTAAYEYSPYGEQLRSQSPDPSVADQPFRLSTKYTDGETGLVYYGRRYYNPSQGRFVGRDPIEEQGGLNLYGFCGNDGVNRWDYLGLLPVIINGKSYNITPVPASMFTAATAAQVYAQGGMWTADPTKWGVSVSLVWNLNGGFGFNINLYNYYYVALPIVPQSPVFPSSGLPPGNISTATQPSDLKRLMENFIGGGFARSGVTLYYRADAGGSGSIANGQTFRGLADAMATQMRNMDLTSADSLIGQLNIVRGLGPDFLMGGIIVLDHSNPDDGPKFGGSVLEDSFYAAASGALSPGGSRVVFFMNCSAFEDPDVLAYTAYYANKYNINIVAATGSVVLTTNTATGAVNYLSANQASDFSWVMIRPSSGPYNPYIYTYNSAGALIAAPVEIAPRPPPSEVRFIGPTIPEGPGTNLARPSQR